MPEIYNYDETFESKVSGIRLDGPSIYTSLLELDDNSFDWGDADEISLSYDHKRSTLEKTDNGPNGFKSVESIRRFFKIGGKNDSVTPKTIGKFGKGGYKGTINISNYFKLDTYIDQNKYTIETDFNDMMENDSQNPTGELITSKNEEDKVGSIFTLKLRPEYHSKFDTETYKKNFIRAYHRFPNYNLKLDKDIIKPSDNCPYAEYLMKEEYILYWNKDQDIFYDEQYLEEELSDSDSDSDNEENINHCEVGSICIYVLKNMITDNEYLGSNPGIDFYRNKRLCNTHNPLRNIGKIGDHIGDGMMRGGRCHMTMNYENVKLTDNLDVDDCIGLTTNKEIPEDNSKFDKSLLCILEEKAKRCSKMYEDAWKERKDKHIEYIDNIRSKLNILDSYGDKELYNDSTDLSKILNDFNNFIESQAWRINELDMSYYYYKSKKEANEAIKKDSDIYKERTNSKIYTSAKPIVNLVTKLIKKKEKYKKYIKKINNIKDQLSIDFKTAEEKFNTDEKIEQLDEDWDEYIENKEDYSSEEYDSALSSITEIIKTIDESNLAEYYEEKLQQLKDYDSQFKILKSETEEEERIQAEKEEKQKKEKEEEENRQKKEKEEEAEERQRKEKEDLINRYHAGNLTKIYEGDNEYLLDTQEIYGKLNIYTTDLEKIYFTNETDTIYDIESSPIGVLNNDIIDLNTLNTSDEDTSEEETSDNEDTTDDEDNELIKVIHTLFEKKQQIENNLQKYLEEYPKEYTEAYNMFEK